MGASCDNSPHAWAADLEFERSGILRQVLRRAVVNPLANYFPARITRFALWLLGSELARENWRDPGGWKSMVISYQHRRDRLADKLLCSLGTMPKALRNRRRLAGRILARLIDQIEDEPVHVLCLGAGPGHVIHDALSQSRRTAHATLVDLSSEAFEYGRRLAAEKGTSDRIRFVLGDVRQVVGSLDRPPHILKMLGICEYLTDDQLADMVGKVSRRMPAGSAVVFNSLSDAHGTDLFFRNVLGLKMIHRSPEHLQRLISGAGFGDFAAVPEPMGVYHVIVGRKRPG